MNKHLSPWYLLIAEMLCLPAFAADTAAPAVNPPSKVENAVKEADLPLLKLTAQAVQRLGIATGTTEMRSFPKVNVFSGTVRLPLGNSADGPNLNLSPVAANGPEDLRKLAELQITADGAIAAAKATLEAAAIARVRAEKLVQDNAGSGKTLDEAKAAEALAKVALDTATGQRKMLGQSVQAALNSTDRWICVNVPSAEFHSLDPKAEVSVRLIGSTQAAATTAKPSGRLPASLPNGSVELCYLAKEAQSPLTLGLQVEVSFPDPAATKESLSVPWSAVIYDATGGAWVYEPMAADTFVRRRVVLSRVVGPTAVLAAGPPVGTKVVTTGTAELFGAEFGGFK